VNPGTHQGQRGEPRLIWVSAITQTSRELQICRRLA
jgi:hypothetical protein